MWSGVQIPPGPLENPVDRLCVSPSAGSSALSFWGPLENPVDRLCVSPYGLNCTVFLGGHWRIQFVRFALPGHLQQRKFQQKKLRIALGVLIIAPRIWILSRTWSPIPQASHRAGSEPTLPYMAFAFLLDMRFRKDAMRFWDRKTI